MSRRRIAIIVGAVVVLAVIGIGVLAHGCMGAKGDAEEVVSNVFALVKEHDYEATVQYYSSSFFKVTGQDEWLAYLAKINEKLGDLVSWELKGWNVNTTVTGTNSGTSVTLTYATRYDNFDAVEIFSLRRSGLSDFKIIGYRISSEGFLAD